MGNGSEPAQFTRKDAERLTRVELGIQNLNDKFDAKIDSIKKSLDYTCEIIEKSSSEFAKQRADCNSNIFPQITKNTAWIRILKWVVGGGGALGFIFWLIKLIDYMKGL